MSFGGKKIKKGNNRAKLERIMKSLAVKFEAEINFGLDTWGSGEMKTIFSLPEHHGISLGIEINTQDCAKGEYIVFAEVEHEKSYLFEGFEEEVIAYLNNTKNIAAVLNAFEC